MRFLIPPLMALALAMPLRGDEFIDDGFGDRGVGKDEVCEVAIGLSDTPSPASNLTW